MLIEIKGTDFENKGAELMLRSIVAEVSGWEPQPGIVVGGGTGPYLNRARLGLYQKFAFGRVLRAGIPDVARLLPASTRARFGLVVEGEIDAVLDANGFAYSSAWGSRPTLRLARASRIWRSARKKVVLLPQALGPFATAEMRDAFRTAVEQVDRVYARDDDSYNHVMELGVPAEKVRMAPDFTTAMPGRLPQEVALGARPAAIVPNIRVVDGGVADRAAYVALLARCAHSLSRLGMSPFVLVHDGGVDRGIAEELARSTAQPIGLVHRRDPLELKGILGACELVVGSRYHALVAALSQNVPVFAIGWSHKYDALLRDYGCPGNVLSAAATQEEVCARIGAASGDGARAEAVRRLGETNERYAEATKAMWADVRGVLTSGNGR